MRKLKKSEKETLLQAQMILEDMVNDEIKTPHTLNVAHVANDFLKAVIYGHGHKTIFITSDDEGNGYHQLFYNLTPALSLEELESIKEENSCMEDYDVKDIALLG